MEQPCYFQSHDIPRPLANDERVVGYGRLTQVHVVGVQKPVGNSYDHQYRLCQEYYAPPGTTPGFHAADERKKEGRSQYAAVGEEVFIVQ